MIRPIQPQILSLLLIINNQQTLINLPTMWFLLIIIIFQYNLATSVNYCFNLYNFYRMQELSNDHLQLSLIDTTSVFTKQINNNCYFDGSTLVYLAGAHILFHNVFQNSKQFMERASDNDVMAIAFHHSTELAVLLVTKDPFCHVEFYFAGKKAVTVDIHQQLQVLDAIFLQKKRVCLLTFDKIKKYASIIIVTSNKKVKKIDLAERCHKITGNQRKIYLLAQFGCYEMNLETEMIEKRKVYQSISLKKIIITQNQEDILLDKSGQCYFMQEYIKKQSFSLCQHFKRPKLQFQSAIRVGHNLLVSIRGEFALAHYIIQQNKLQFVNIFQYSEKLRGNIIAMHSSIDQMNLAIALQTTYKDKSRVQHFLFNLSALSNEKKFINPFVKLQSGGQIGEVSNFQCIIPSEMYCLVGPHIINYTYIEHIEKKHKYSIHQSPKSIAVHPLGHQLLCIFETAFKFYQKVQMDLVETWTQPMICSCAKYTESGLLILCVYQDGFQNIVVYNPNNFRRIRSFNGLYLKHAVSRIQLDESQQQLILYCQKDLLIHRFKSGQRLSQFRQKKQMPDVSCIQYDSIRKWLLVASRQNIIICKKTEDYLLNFNSQRTILVNHQVTCIRINQHAQTIFMGTSNGVILYTSYPLLEINEQTIDDQRIFRAVHQSVKIHSQPIVNLILTNNCKFLFASVKGDGITILRAKRLNAGKGTYNPFDSSNYNFIETSSTPYLQNIQQKLKNLLEKRKTIFNELDQFKKQWQSKRIAQTKKLTTQNKRKELQSINIALEEINKCKQQHASLISQLNSLQSLTLNTKEQNQKIHHKELLSCYEENDKRKEKLMNVQKKCQDQWNDISTQCLANLQDIRQELQIKFRNFQTTYLMMKSNLVNYRRRMEFEQSEDIAVKQELIATTKLHLKQEEQQLYKRNNQLKGQITKNRKQLQRFVNRKDFLQNKQRFFVEQLRYCQNQENQLVQVKQNLQKQLVDLQEVTHKKEKRLRKYFIENQILIKYQIIHDNLTKQSNKEIEFIDEEHRRLKQNIGQLQKEILYISQQRQKHKKQLSSKKHKLESEKAENIKLRQKRDFLYFQIQQIQDKINAANTGKIVDQESKNQDFVAIYQNFFVQKKLETFLSNRQAKTDELMVSENKRSQLGIQAVLQDHKEYLIKNMGLFQKYNTRVMDEINLTFMKYQSENYDLISQCNIRKQQINKKKRALHQLVSDIRQTNNQIAALHHSRPIHKQTSQTPSQIPFHTYEQSQHQNQSRLQLKKDKSQSAMWKIKKSSYQVRKMLQIQKLKSNNCELQKKDKRRIQTATLKNKTHQYNNELMFAQESLDVMNPMGSIQYDKKPQTALHRYRKKQNQQARRLFSRNKSNSKPTTCTSHTKSKKSMFL